VRKQSTYLGSWLTPAIRPPYLVDLQSSQIIYLQIVILEIFYFKEHCYKIKTSRGRKVMDFLASHDLKRLFL
jgi:hypothetical protein